MTDRFSRYCPSNGDLGLLDIHVLSPLELAMSSRTGVKEQFDAIREQNPGPSLPTSVSAIGWRGTLLEESGWSLAEVITARWLSALFSHDDTAIDIERELSHLA